MSFELHERKHIDDELRKIARRQLRDANDALTARKAVAFETRVHESRKSVKKVRAVLEMLERAGAEVPRKDRKRVKKAAQVLSAVRDSAAIIETFDRVHRRYPKRLREHTYRILRGALVRSRDRQERRARRNGVVASAAKQLDRTRAAAKRWTVPSLEFPEVIAGATDSYRRSRKAMRRAVETRLSPTVHGWRKEVKTLWYQLRLAVPLTKGLTSLVRDLERLETALGEDHNSVVLGATLRGCTDVRSMRADVRMVEKLAARMRQSRRKQVFALGRRVHRRKPKAFARWMRGISKQARQEPEAA